MVYVSERTGGDAGTWLTVQTGPLEMSGAGAVACADGPAALEMSGAEAEDCADGPAVLQMSGAGADDCAAVLEMGGVEVEPGASGTGLEVEAEAKI